MAKCLFSGSSGGLPKSLLEQITAGAGDVLAGKVIVGADGEPLTGTIEIKNGQTITPTPNAQTIACKGKYMTGDIVINGASIYKQYYEWISGSNGSRTYVAADGSSWRKTWRYKTFQGVNKYSVFVSWEVALTFIQTAELIGMHHTAVRCITEMAALTFVLIIWTYLQTEDKAVCGYTDIHHKERKMK